MINLGHCGSNPEAPGESRCCCPIPSNHRQDFLGVYFHWLSVVADDAYPLCGHASMDGDHLLQCTELDEYPTEDIVNRYWEAFRQMVKM
ncbi:hypothetical protein TNCV_4327511 [Trichonephila clavipes]|nr:hypothetical protein TNCV_4327511 [Trichonephila clavipes]